jgi:Na+-translocating ferredoxin:NAD+ oxidoreductase subunit B
MMELTMLEDDIYQRLRRELDRLPIPFPATKSGVELRLLQKLFTREEAEIAIHISALPEKASKIHKRLGNANISPEHLEQSLNRMVKKGAIRRVRNSSNRDEFRYGKMPLAIGMFEAQVDKLTKGLAEDFFQYGEEAFGAAVVGNRTNQIRTIPLNLRIEPDFQVSNYDDITKIVGDSPGPFAVMNCICRQAKDKTGRPCSRTQDRESCILIEDGVEFARNLAVGREISKTEVLHLISKAKKAGLVLQPENTQHPHFVCCCCGCCCGVLTAAQLFAKPAEYLHSNYFAKVDAEKCELCGICLKRCPMDAFSRTNNHMEVSLDRCIGCGACIPACKEKAIQLIRKREVKVPPKTDMGMYKNIMLERFGWLGTLRIAAKAVVGAKV